MESEHHHDSISSLEQHDAKGNVQSSLLVESQAETNGVFLTDSGRWSIKLLLMLTLSVCECFSPFETY